ncbi:MAG: hypothetical protein KC800_04980 [Candidatus Eremiobacteraeota bacterium]|nr:hypothetical protein [Candidatus Eremiobacteraeota bacterium]
MNCLFCGHQLPYEPIQTCPGCEMEHEPVPPVSTVNHVSQMLYACELLEAGELDEESFFEVTSAFLDKFEAFSQRWKLSEQSLVDSANPAIREKFGAVLEELDQALGIGYGAVEALEAVGSQGFDALAQAQELLRSFYQNSCAASAKLFEQLDSFHGADGGDSGLLNLPTV